MSVGMCGGVHNDAVPVPSLKKGGTVHSAVITNRTIDNNNFVGPSVRHYRLMDIKRWSMVVGRLFNDSQPCEDCIRTILVLLVSHQPQEIS